MRRSCVGVLADSSKRRDAGAPAVCLGVPFRERDDGSWDNDHEGDDDENEKAKMTALGRRRNGDENVGWKFACVGYGSAKSVSQSGRRKTFEEEEEGEEELPRCRGLEILVSERVLNKNDDEDDAETTHGDQRRREERRRRGLTDVKEDKDDFIVALREKPDENEIDRKRNRTTTSSSSKSASSSEKEESGVFAGRQRRLFPPPNGTPTPSSSRERERKIDAEHKLPPELKTFKQRFYMQSKLIWTRMEKHAKYVYSGAFAKDL